ncbi:MAG TPA: hypothetical protein PLO89_10125 [Spirochaetota bacterium]|nr:hypothetical protein [Spirochaetota bacterium]
MKERFLNLFLFIISLAFMTSGVFFMFFNKAPFINFVVSGFDSYFSNLQFSYFFLSLLGVFIFSWGIFFSLLTVFAVMELKSSAIYPFIFWGFTFWAVLSGIVSFLHSFYFFILATGIAYLILFIPFFISLAMKSKSSSQN